MIDELTTPLGVLTLAADHRGALVYLGFQDHEPRPRLLARAAAAELTDDPALLAPIRAQLEAYCRGELRAFALALAPQGTPFQLRVWEELRRIPYGTTISYGELARRLGDAKRTRAVGTANGANPISIVIPCHRVIGTDGSLTGYAGGLDLKRALLDLEQGPGPYGWLS